MSPGSDLLRSYCSLRARRTGCRNEAELLEGREGGMLVLSRKASQQVMIGSDIRITIVRIDRNQVRIGIEAPGDVRVFREEILGASSRRAEEAVAAGV